MRKKFILIRLLPILIIIILFILLIKQDIFFSYEIMNSNSSSTQDESSNQESLTESILDAIINLNAKFKNLFTTRAYPQIKANQTKLKESLKLTTRNLELYGHLCSVNQSEIFIGLMSKANSFEIRNVIRNTLAKQISESNQKLLFFVAESLNETVNELVDEESLLNEDMVQLEFLEDYYNLTLKTISFLQYFNSYCDQFKFAIKLDDDVFLNWYGTQEFLFERLSIDEPRIYCKIHRRARVLRNIDSKWFVDKQIYPEKIFPDYCG